MRRGSTDFRLGPKTTCYQEEHTTTSDKKDEEEKEKQKKMPPCHISHQKDSDQDNRTMMVKLNLLQTDWHCDTLHYTARNRTALPGAALHCIELR